MKTLLAAVHSVDITPHDFPGIRLGGFGFNRKATGILHPLEAGIVALSDGDETVVLVSVDSVGLQLPWVERIRAAVTAPIPRERVIVCSTHSHAAPDTLGYWGPSFLFVLPRKPGIEPAYMAQLVATIARGVDEAVAALRPARVAAARFELPAGLFTNHREGGALDNSGLIVRLTSQDAEPLGCVLSFAAHPEGLWDRNTRVSPDYPHHARATLRAAGLGTPVFFSGALGGMLTPDIPKPTPTAARELAIERLGVALGEAAVAAARQAKPAASAPLQIARERFRVPFANWRFRLARRLGIFERELTADDHVWTEMNLVRLGSADDPDARLQWLSIPGEALPELGRLFKERLGGGTNLLLCLGCDELGYLLPPELWDEKEYAYECTMSVHRSVADTLLDNSETLVGRLDGA